jgi:ribosomal protein L1
MHEKVQHLNLIKRRIAVFARGSRARESENAGANNRPDPQRR